jgi:hypothetical protein
MRRERKQEFRLLLRGERPRVAAGTQQPFVKRRVAFLEAGEKAPVEPLEPVPRVQILEGAVEAGCRDGGSRHVGATAK